jgi:uncharacterized membrane protein YfcA
MKGLFRGRPGTANLIAGAVTFAFTTVLTVAGVGAAFILIPVFLYLGIGLHTAMATALLLNALAMFFACLRFVPAGMVDFRAALPILIVATILSPLGAWSGAYLPVPLLKGLFVGFLLFAATMMLFYRAKPHEARLTTGIGGMDGHLLAWTPAGSVAGSLLGAWLMQKKLAAGQVKKTIGIILYVIAVQMAWKLAGG